MKRSNFVSSKATMAAVIFAALAACSSDVTVNDGGLADARRDSGSGIDTGVRDTGGGVDTGTLDVVSDTGTGMDSGTNDSGTTDTGTRPDTGTNDTGASDTGGGTDGAVTCGTTTCATGLACCPYTNRCYDRRCLACCMPVIDAGSDSGPAGCVDNSMCAATDYCSGTTCGGPGTCIVRPEICTTLFDPVCACDGRTYSNACTAAAAGQRVASRGACSPVPDAGGPMCTSSTMCPTGSLCCLSTGRCYDRRCLACCMPMP
jgi:hypothetical protein